MPSPAARAEQLRQQGEQERRAGRADAAEAAFVEAMGLNGNDPAILTSYGSFLADYRQSYANAERHLRRAVELDPDNPKRYAELARILKNAGRPQAVDAVYDAALATSNVDQRWLLGDRSLHRRQRGDWVGAERDARAALLLAPTNSWTVKNLAYVLYGQGRFDEALKLAEEAIRLDTSDPNARGLLGEIFYQLGRILEAIAAFTEAVRLSPLANPPQSDAWWSGKLRQAQQGSDSRITPRPAPARIVEPTPLPQRQSQQPAQRQAAPPPPAAVATTPAPAPAPAAASANACGEPPTFHDRDGERIEAIRCLPGLEVSGAYADPRNPNWRTTLDPNGTGTWMPFSNTSERIRWWVVAENGQPKSLGKTELGQVNLILMQTAGGYVIKLLEISHANRTMMFGGELVKRF